MVFCDDGTPVPASYRHNNRPVTERSFVHENPSKAMCQRCRSAVDQAHSATQVDIQEGNALGAPLMCLGFILPCIALPASLYFSYSMRDEKPSRRQGSARTAFNMAAVWLVILAAMYPIITLFMYRGFSAVSAVATVGKGAGDNPFGSIDPNNPFATPTTTPMPDVTLKAEAVVLHPVSIIVFVPVILALVYSVIFCVLRAVLVKPSSRRDDEEQETLMPIN